MNIQKMVNNVLASQMDKLGSECVHINGQDVQAVLAETDNDRDIIGGSRNSRDLTAQFPTDPAMSLRVGMVVDARGKQWKVNRVSKGQSMTTLELIEPNRKDE